MGNMVEGKVVVVTGAGAGIGRDFAKAFAANGAKVVVNDLARSAENVYAAEGVAQEIKSAGGDAVAVVAAGAAKLSNWSEASASPSRNGSIASRTMRSGVRSWAAARARRPVVASSTSKPS